MVWILIIFLYKEVLLGDKSDLDSGLKTKNSSLALLSYLYKLYSERYGELLYFGISSINSEKEKSANIQQEHLVEIFLCYVCKHEKNQGQSQNIINNVFIPRFHVKPKV